MKLKLHSFEDPPLHVVGKCNTSEWPAGSRNEAWSIFSQKISDFQHKGVRTFAFVMMSNHYHWLCTYPDLERNPQFFYDFHKFLNEKFFSHQNANLQVINPPPSTLDIAPHITVLDHVEAYRQAYRYVYRNPVEAGLVHRAEDYDYSTLPYILGKKPQPFSCIDNMNLITDPMRILRFINSCGNDSSDVYF